MCKLSSYKLSFCSNSAAGGRSGGSALCARTLLVGAAATGLLAVFALLVLSCSVLW